MRNLNYLYSSPNIVQVMKSRRMRGTGHVACIRREEYTEFGQETLRVRDHLEDPGVDGRIILGWILRKWDVGVYSGSSWLRIGTGDGYF
jgi:hypothetical protein